MSRVSLTIDGIALRGFGAADRDAVVQALEGELRRVLADPATRAAWARSHRTPVLKLGRMAFTPGPAGGQSLGVRIGRAIGKGLRP